MKIKTPNTTPFFVLVASRYLPSGRVSTPVVFGGNYKRERCERIVANPYSHIADGTARIIEYSSRLEAWKAHRDELNIAHGGLPSIW